MSKANYSEYSVITDLFDCNWISCVPLLVLGILLLYLILIDSFCCCCFYFSCTWNHDGHFVGHFVFIHRHFLPPAENINDSSRRISKQTKNKSFDLQTKRQQQKKMKIERKENITIITKSKETMHKIPTDSKKLATSIERISYSRPRLM